jgi:hypothetical protein
LGSPPDTQAVGLVGVWLADTEEGIAVNTERGQVGMLRDEDMAAYLPIMRLAHEKEVVAVMPAVLSKNQEELFACDLVYRPDKEVIQNFLFTHKSLQVTGLPPKSFK